MYDLVEVDPKNIRFSQDHPKRQGEFLPQIMQSMKKNGFVVKHDEVMDFVLMPDGAITSLDNTRLLAAKRTNTMLKGRIHSFEDALPNDPEFLSRFIGRKNEIPSTWGEALMNRISRQKSKFRTNNPLGSPLTASKN